MRRAWCLPTTERQSHGWCVNGFDTAYLSLAATVCGSATRRCVANAWTTCKRPHTFRVRSPGSEYLVNRERSVEFAADAESRCGFHPESRGPACSLLLNSGFALKTSLAAIRWLCAVRATK